MNTTTLVIGTAVFMFGVYTAFMRHLRPQKLGRLSALKDLFGDTTGDRIHLIAYAGIPLVSGVIFLFAGIKGVSLF
ncbi:MAG TPA: hypothetical protein VGE12_17200 [Noviherbaspirillum sp.]